MVWTQAKLNKREKATMALVGFLQIGLIIGKLAGRLHWHWLVILLPTEIVVGIFIGVIVVAFAIILYEGWE